MTIIITTMDTLKKIVEDELMVASKNIFKQITEPFNNDNTIYTFLKNILETLDTTKYSYIMNDVQTAINICIDERSDKNNIANGNRLLAISCIVGDLHMCEYILQKYQHCNLKLMLCIIHGANNGHLHIIKFIFEKGIDIDVSDVTDCIQNCIQKGYSDIVKYFIENIKNIKLSAYIKCSIKYRRTDILKYLVEKGADINLTDNIVECAQKGYLDIVRYLVENQLSEHNRSILLRYAAGFGHIDIVKYLVENGTDINKVCPYFHDPLFLSARFGKLNVVKYLVENGADIRTSYAYMCSETEKHIDVFKYLIKTCLENNIAIPDAMITNEINEANKFSFMHVDESQHHLFNKKIVETYHSLKNTVNTEK